jgi:hypothetical protein
VLHLLLLLLLGYSVPSVCNSTHSSAPASRSRMLVHVMVVMVVLLVGGGSRGGGRSSISIVAVWRRRRRLVTLAAVRLHDLHHFRPLVQGCLLR